MRLANLKPRSGVVHDLNLLRPISNHFRKEARKVTFLVMLELNVSHEESSLDGVLHDF